MILVSVIITISYLFLIGCFVFGFDKIKLFELEDMSSKTTFSVIIPFRNEAENLPDLLKSIESLEYPSHLFEIIFVDDASDDNSVDLIMRFLTNARNDIKVIKNKRTTNSPKKDAITTAVKQSKNKWIITTDADCLLPKYWLDSFDAFIQKTNTTCIAAPITYMNSSSFLDQFQLLDILSLQGATIGGFGINKPFLCNGANFGYEKPLFLELNGFEGNTDIASGDDIFLLEKVVETDPEQLHYLKCDKAIVKTKSQPSWKDLISQRIRWAGKTSAYNNWFGKFTGLIVLLMNALLISTFLLAILNVFNFKIWGYILILKFSVDFLLIYKSAYFFNQKTVLRCYIFGFIVYPFFSFYVAFASLFKTYKWKGRSFKK
ncbi:glycosyltransferase [Flavivirga abyssicola]|uniref:glycosyltransferase family 2 protein n=1 Tax=Flavivirga abyssicola TaxID=3063533 RepID=UPI0026DEB055|nr:glycosyltransferase [Flavivirga sp. MEBiC07777]WVK11633.1 glycosyltransferase [Flavivirga sp. MEBiC07777]